jgi:hypothetical protein
LREKNFYSLKKVKMPATHQAVFAEMVSDGHADKALTTKNSEDTGLCFWRASFSRYLPFSLEPVDWDASASQAKFGASGVKYEVPRQGDLLWHTYAKILLPGIVGTYRDANGDLKVLKGSQSVHWHNAIGIRALQNVTLSVGGIQIVNFDETFNYINTLVTQKPGRRLREAIGKFDTVEEQQGYARRSHTCYVPLPLPNNEHVGNSLPLCAMTFHKVLLDASFATRAKCVIIPEGAPPGVQICVRPDGVKDADIESGKVTVEPLADNHLRCLFEGTMVYLETQERALFTDTVFEQLISEVQSTSVQASFHGSQATETTPPVKLKVPLPFANIVSEYLWVVRTQSKEDRNQHYNFGGFVEGEEDGFPYTLDPLKEVAVKYANAPRVSSRPADYYRLVQPHNFHTHGESAETNFIYNWSFAVHPESDQASGGCNHSRVDDVSLECALDARIFSPESPTAEVIVYGRAWNLLRFRQGTLLRRFT